jgi:hypothetical protein
VIGYLDGPLALPAGSLEPSTAAVDVYEPDESGRLVYRETIDATSYSADAEAEDGTYVELARGPGGGLLFVWIDCEPSAAKLRAEDGDGMTDEDGEFLFEE